ncbi:MAG: hypothetical protein ACTSPS_16530, partial [Promethearchaeota archaeon]
HPHLWLRISSHQQRTHNNTQQQQLNGADLVKMNGAFELVKDYCNDFVEFLLNNIYAIHSFRGKFINQIIIKKKNISEKT